MERGMNKVVLVTRKTRLNELVYKYNTIEQAKFYIEHLGADFTDYMREVGIRVKYLHSDIDTLERAEIIRDMRMDVFDVLVGINLLREGLDIPEITLVAILDADKEGFLRSETSLIQTIGRAARNSEGHVIMYADTITDSMRIAIEETNRRRKIQQQYNEEHGITPTTIQKAIRDLIAISKAAEASSKSFEKDPESMDIKELGKQNIVVESVVNPNISLTVLVIAVDRRDNKGYYMEIGRHGRMTLYWYGCRMLRKMFGPDIIT